MVDKDQQMIKQFYINLVIFLFISEDIPQKRTYNDDHNSVMIDLISLPNGISTFVGYLMSNNSSRRTVPSNP